MQDHGRTTLLGAMVAAIFIAGCAQQRTMRRVEQHIARYQHPPHIEVALLRGQAAPDMTPADVRVALGDPLPVQRTGPLYALPLAEAYRVRRYGRIDTVWVFFDRDSTVVLVER